MRLLVLNPFQHLPVVAVWLQFDPSNPRSHEHLSLAVQTPETHGELHVSGKKKKERRRKKKLLKENKLFRFFNINPFFCTEVTKRILHFSKANPRAMRERTLVKTKHLIKKGPGLQE